MDGEKIQRTASDTALALPDASVSEPFGPDYEVYKVRGKVFMLTTEVPGLPIVTLKCDPADGTALRQAHESITPGYHMNKRHWISIGAGEDITEQLVAELVGDSYALVVAQMTKTVQAQLRMKSGR